MKTYEIDLYEYFQREKPEGARGLLTCFVHKQSQEIRTCVLPAMLIFPGGGYSMTSDREGTPIALEYLHADYNAFVLRYSVAPVRFPVALQEAAMAMVYIRENAQTLGIDAMHVAALGCSAGGHLLGTLSTMYTHEALDFLGDRKGMVRPDASVYLYPVVSGVEKAHEYSFMQLLGDNYKEKLESVSIEKRVNADTPPSFIVATRNDPVVPVKNSLLLANALEEQGVPFALHIFERGLHGLSVGKRNVYGEEAYADVQKATSSAFMKWVELSVSWLKDRGFIAK